MGIIEFFERLLGNSLKSRRNRRVYCRNCHEKLPVNYISGLCKECKAERGREVKQQKERHEKEKIERSGEIIRNAPGFGGTLR